jgi:hypothetical protein
MGAIPVKECIFLCSNINKKIETKDINLDKLYSLVNQNKIILIQSVIRGYLLRNNLFNYKDIKEISIDYNTDHLEKNQMIQRLNNLLPKFELTDKEEYEINNTNNKIVALLYPNKAIYKGMINDKGQKEGFGKYFLADGSIYKGFFHNNKMEGRGRIININGFIYEGEFKNGQSNGYGKYIALDGTTYKGTWLDDRQSGTGNEVYPDGSFYNGSFKEGKKNGFGKLVFKDKNIYEGHFVNNEICGEGGFYWKDGRIYIGNWYDNKMNGYGIFIWPDKKKYYGNYINNLKEGFGIFYWNDGYKFEGYWKEGKQNGYGFIGGNNKNKYGFWNNGKLENKINDDETIAYIEKKINETKNEKEYKNFLLNIAKYEKQIIDGSSSQDTNFNSKDKEKNN